MNVKLNEFIDKYLPDASERDEKVALHLQKIIPKTNHLNKNTFNEIIAGLVNEMEAGNDFKTAFKHFSGKYLLAGNIIEQELPDVLTRIILNVKLLLKFLSRETGIAVEFIEKRFKTIGFGYIKSLLLDHLKLAPGNVVFATFNEESLEEIPFKDENVADIINMMAMDVDCFDEDEALTAVLIRYRTDKHVEKRFPLFLDAGWYDKFFPSSREDKFGRTRSLDPSLKNMPEIVHQNMNISEVVEEIYLLED